jgi:hypothetical protein
MDGCPWKENANMQKKDALTKTLAIAGTVLAWFPLAAPVLLTLIFFLSEGLWRFDYLMPAELFLFALGGGLLLLWAALRAHSRSRLIGFSLAGAALLLVASQGIAVLTGLASGAREAAGWPLAIVLGALIAYILALLVLAIGGVLLWRDLFRKA